MKKIILGLFLSVGISVSHLAAAPSIKEVKLKNAPLSNLTTFDNNFDEFADCTITTVYRVTGQCGGRYGDFEFAEEATGSACEGTEEGVVFNVETVTVDDCF